MKRMDIIEPVEYFRRISGMIEEGEESLLSFWLQYQVLSRKDTESDAQVEALEKQAIEEEDKT